MSMNRETNMEKFLSVLVLLWCALQGGCVFPSKRIESVDVQAIPIRQTITIPTKVFLKDGTIILYQNGFIADEKTIKGVVLRYGPDGAILPASDQSITVSRDQVAAMSYYHRKLGAGNILGGAILGLTAPPLTFLGVYCVINPKACFGSCPTVYTLEGGEYRLTAELFSFSVGGLAESDDLDLLAARIPPQGEPFEVRVTNEAMETHHINRMSLLKVVHPRGTTVVPTSDGRLIAFRGFLPPAGAWNCLGTDVLADVAVPDQRIYRSPLALVERVKTGPFLDHIDVKAPVPRSASAANVRVRLRNTLLSTLLFYDIVLGSQGLDALAWTDKMNSDPVYAARFGAIYQFFSGVNVKERSAAGWRMVGRIHDVGPIAFKDVALRVPLSGQEELELRLEFFPDNFMIDAVSFDFEDGALQPDLVREALKIEKIIDNSGLLRPEVEEILGSSDDRYLTVEPGQAYRFFARVPDRPDDRGDLSLFVSSRGFYNEWLRGKWLAPRDPGDYRFDLDDTAATLRRLGERWLETKNEMEENFFKARIPIRGER